MADATKPAFPHHKARGWLLGKPFVVQYVIVWQGGVQDDQTGKKEENTYQLVLRQGGEAADISDVTPGLDAASDRFSVILHLLPEKTLDNRLILVRPGDESAGLASPNAKAFLSGRSPVTVSAERKGQKAENVHYLETGQEFTLRLQFGKQHGKTLPGRIYLCLKDKQESYVAGTFEAQLDEQPRK